MSDKYDPKKIEEKWQKYWEENKSFEVDEDSKKEKFYSLIEFPYPSGDGLHVGHPRPFTAMDVVSRYKRMQGYNVLYPIGFDAFGLPTENYAIKTGRPPAEVTSENIANFTRQLKMLGYSFDWSRVVDTTDPDYYKWTQWIFLQLFKHGLAYKKNMPINWCLDCKIGLANEEVVDGKCERCGGAVEKRDKEQWMLAITKYADKLLDGLDEVDYIKRAKIQQQNWVGRSEGASVVFSVIASLPAGQAGVAKQSRINTVIASEAKQSCEHTIEVFTTRPDTLFGATYMVVSPEHELIEKFQDQISNFKEVSGYIEKAKLKSDLERTELQKEKTGVELKGLKAVNPVNGEEIPVWVADYVLISYGTGAIMAVPAHDQRDWEFATKYGIEIREVVTGGDIKKQAYSGEGKNVSSDFIDGLETQTAKEKMIEWLEEKGAGKKEVNYKLRDWVFSRQRYWGEPIPLVYCEACENKKYNYVLLHGFTGRSDKNFFPKIVKKLEVQGHTVYCPDLPNTDEPQVDEQVKCVMDNCKFDENTILLGHSLGGVVAMKLLEKLNIKLNKVILLDSFIQPEFNDKKRPGVVKSCDWKFDFEKIKTKTEEIIILADNTFVTIPKNQSSEMTNLLSANLQLVKPNSRHFVGENEPEVERVLQINGWIPVPEDQLPVELPKVEKYEPTDTGESPLACMTDWVNTTCPKCGELAKRETDTMPNWAGSSWYFLRYCDPDNNQEFASMEKLKYWMPVDWYNGGMEHTVLHLLYSRFWNLFLYDIGAVPDREPYQKRTSHGMILAPDGEKMSKSRGNVINPDEIVAQFGTDAFRAYIMFMGPFDQDVAWDTNGLVGVKRFLDRVWALWDRIDPAIVSVAKQSRLQPLLHQTIKKVTQDIEKMHFNTAIAKMMEWVNELHKHEHISKFEYSSLIKLLAPFAPHMCEELWQVLGNKTDLVAESWPEYDESKIVEDNFTLAIQINGKLRDTLEVSIDISEDDAKQQALESKKVQKWLDVQEPKKIIYVKGKLVSIVI
ncbi:MAG: leucine--tRNA ligase [bacterium]